MTSAGCEALALFPRDPQIDVRRVQGLIRRVVRRILGAGNPAVDDISQDAWLAVSRALPAFRGDCQLSTYAAKIAARTARRARSARHADAPGVDELQELPSDEAGTCERLVSVQTRRALLSLLQELPVEQADALTLRIVQGYSRSDIARLSGVSENTVKSRLRLAKATLRRRIEADPHLSELMASRADGKHSVSAGAIAAGSGPGR